MKNYQTHYQILQVREDASFEVIKGAYRYLSQKWHPDKHGQNKEQAEAVIKNINAAYFVLSHPRRRAQYDAFLRDKRVDSGDQPSEPYTDNDKTEDIWHSDAGKRRPPFLGGVEPYPIWRWAARVVDLSITSALYASLVWSLTGIDLAYSPTWSTGWHVLPIIILMLTIEISLIAEFATTPGKWIFGIRIVKPNGKHLSYKEALERSIKVWWRGLAAGVPILSFFTMLHQAQLLHVDKITSYDKEGPFSVRGDKLGPIRKAIICLVLLVVSGVLFIDDHNFIHADYIVNAIDSAETAYRNTQYDSMVKKLEEAYPEINPDSKRYNQEVVDWILMRRDQYIELGYKGSIALEEAVLDYYE